MNKYEDDQRFHFVIHTLNTPPLHYVRVEPASQALNGL